MKAIILAAGRGTRLGELGKEIPKCLIEIEGQTLLENKVEMLKKIGISEEDILVVIGKQGECWTEENLSKIGAIAKNLVVNSENSSTSNSYSAKLALDKIENEDVAVIDGDLMISEGLLKEMMEKPGNLVLSKKSFDREGKRNKLLLDENGKLLEMGKKIEKEKLSFPYLVYGAFMKIQKQDLLKLKETISKEIYKTTNSDFLVNELSKNMEIRTVTGDKWVNINKPEELEDAKKLFSRNFVILMRGHTFVGKSTIAREIFPILNANIFHSAIIRKELNLDKFKTLEEADKFFDYRTGIRKEVDKKVYGKLAEKALQSLQKNKDVILDGSYPLNWQRELVYETIPSDTEVFVLRVVCENEEEIKKRLKIREKDFGTSPFHETPSWNTYTAIKEIAEDIEKDSIQVNIIDYDNLTKKAKLVRGDEKSENSKKILNALNSEKIIVQDENFNFLKEKASKTQESVKNKFVIALDFDGVITNQSKLKTQYINEKGNNIKEEECGYDACVRHGNVKEEDYIKARGDAQTADPGVLPLAENFLKVFSYLKKLENVFIFILTSRYENMLEHLERYMKHYKIRVDGIINTADKSKTQHLKDLNARIFVDDSPYKLENIFKELEGDDFVKKCSFILYRTKENSPEKNPSSLIVEIDNWKDLKEIILKKMKFFHISQKSY